MLGLGRIDHQGLLRINRFVGEKHNDLIEIIAYALAEMKREQGEKFNTKENVYETNNSNSLLQ